MTARHFNGIGVSAGVVAGRAHLLRAEPLPLAREPLPAERIDQELERFHNARRLAHAELEDLRQQVPAALGPSYVGILEAQRLILDDPGLVDETCRRIRSARVSARWALKEVAAVLLRRFEAAADEYLRERGGELTEVHLRLQRLLCGEARPQAELPAGPLIVVAPLLGPADAFALASANVVGLVTDAGGRTSHTAIVAQALALPVVVGLADLSRRVRVGEWLIVDGDRGTVTGLGVRELSVHPRALGTVRQALRQVWAGTAAREVEQGTVGVDGARRGLGAEVLGIERSDR